MDDYEKRVTKKRRQELLQHLTIGDKYVYLLRHHKILDMEGAVAILDLKSNAARVSKLVDILCKSSIENIFDMFCQSLDSFDLKWIAKEMKTELLGLRGSNDIDDDVRLEAATLVHSKFGSSKRMSEGDKKQIQSMVALKIQMAKEEWRVEVESLREQLRDYKIDYYIREDKMKNIIATTKAYLRKHESSLVTVCHDMRSTSDTLKMAAKDGDIIACFEPILDDFFQRVIRIVKERDLFYSERMAIIKMLKLRDEPTSIVDSVRCSIRNPQHSSSFSVDSCSLNKDRLLAETQQQVEMLEARLLKQNDKLKILTMELKGRGDAKIRYKQKKRPDKCLSGSTPNISKLGAPPKTKSTFPTLSKTGRLSPPTTRHEKKCSTESS